MNLTPIQKLSRLKAIETTLSTPPPLNHDRTAEVTNLLNERSAIFSTVGTPPLELMGSTDSHAWAAAFVEAFPMFDRETAQLWFVNLMLAGVEAGRSEGQDEGRKAAATELGMPRLVATLELVRDGLKSGAVKSQGIVDIANPAGPRRPLVERIVEDLAAVGVTE